MGSESNWRQNIANSGWSGSEWDLYARYLPLDGYDGPAAIRSGVTRKWFVVFPTIFGDELGFFFDAGPLTFAEVAAAGTLEPD